MDVSSLGEGEHVFQIRIAQTGFHLLLSEEETLDGNRLHRPPEIIPKREKISSFSTMPFSNERSFENVSCIT